MKGGGSQGDGVHFREGRQPGTEDQRLVACTFGTSGKNQDAVGRNSQLDADIFELLRLGINMHAFGQQGLLGLPVILHQNNPGCNPLVV